MLSYTKSLSSPQVHLPRPGPTTTPSKSSPASASVQISYKGWQDTRSDMVAYRLLMYSPMGWIPTASIASTNGDYSHSPPAPRFSVSPVIRRASQWCKPSRTLSISPITIQLFLPYNSTDCSTALYIAPRDRTIAPVFSIPLATIPHRL